LPDCCHDGRLHALASTADTEGMSTPAADPTWLAEVEHRIMIDEGCCLTRYPDSRGIATLGIGYNLQRGDAPTLLASLGIDYAAVMAYHPITQPQCDALFQACLSGIVAAARNSLAPGIYDALSDARRFVLCDLEYNLGETGWLGFAGTRAILNQAQKTKMAGQLDAAHKLFEVAADHLTASDWYGQVGNRARRNVAMIRSGVWVSATGDGSV
jgi:GH24 family phage-related lysozyme (muramidase)